jgi:hypothetical protein
MFLMNMVHEMPLGKQIFLTFSQIYLINQGKTQTGNIMQKDGCEEKGYELNKNKTRSDCQV